MIFRKKFGVTSEFYSTTDTEQAIRELSKRYSHVVVKIRHRIAHPIYLRANQFTDLGIHIWRPWLPGSGYHMEQWAIKGGILLDYTNNQATHPIPVKYQAHVHIECPLLDYTFHDDVKEAEVAVVFKPANWQPHKVAIDSYYPTTDMVRRVWNFLLEKDKSGMTERELTACVVAGIQPYGVVMASDGEISKACLITSTSSAQTAMIMGRNSYVKGPVRGVKLRIEPEFDGALMEAYRTISEWPEHYRGERMYVTRRFHRQIRELVRFGCLQKMPTLYAYSVTGAEPDWHEIDDANKRARESFGRMREIVEKAEVMK